MKGVRLTRTERVEVRRRIALGESFEQAAEAVHCTTKTVQRLLNAVGGIAPRPTRTAKLRLSLTQREEISLGLEAGESARKIGVRLGRASSTISREVAHNGGRTRYRVVRAEAASYCRASRPKEAKFAGCPRLRTEVETMLDKAWSPQQISARLVVEFPDDLEMRVSHETIYRSLFVQSRGALRKEPTACLRTAPAKARSRSDLA